MTPIKDWMKKNPKAAGLLGALALAAAAYYGVPTPILAPILCGAAGIAC